MAGRPRGMLFDVGYAPYGKYAITENGDRTKEYAHFHSMFNRVFGKSALKHRETYRDCNIDEHFHNFQVFAEWCNKQVGFSEDGWQLDKDILIKGNRTYSPMACVFVPNAINCIFAAGTKNDTLPKGVYWKPKRACYVSAVSVDNKFKHLGYFNTIDDAKAAYDKAKIDEVCRVAEKYRSRIDKRVYEILLNFKGD